MSREQFELLLEILLGLAYLHCSRHGCLSFFVNFGGPKEAKEGKGEGSK